ncbi:MCE family protein [Williamsia sp. SKLECPSW1]
MVTLIVGSSYLLMYALRIDPAADTYTVTVELTASGGLQPGSDVTLHGYRVGHVSGVDLDDTGVVATAIIRSGIRISSSTDVAVADLSAAGEQYLDFRPSTDEGPYLSSGSIVHRPQTDIPTPFATMLSHVSDVVAQIDPAKLESTLAELDRALAGGPDQLATLIDSAQTLFDGLYSALPQTTKLIRTGRTVLATFGAATPDLETLSRSGGVVADQLTAADSEIRRLLNDVPGEIDSVSSVIHDNRSSGGDLLRNLARIATAGQLRAPALQAVFPSIRDLGNSLALIGDGQKVNVAADIYPRPTCEYSNPMRDPTLAGTPDPLLYMYCVTDRPDVQVRGAANAPRPPGDDTAGPPTGVTGTERARPTP